MSDEHREPDPDRVLEDETHIGPRPRRRRRWLRRALLALLVLALGTGLLLIFLLVRPTGLRILLDRAGPLIGGELTYTSAHGRLLDAWGVDGLRFRQVQEGRPTGLEVEIGRVSVRWRPMALTGGVVDLISVEAEDVHVTRPPGEEAPGPTELPDVRLPVSVRVDEARIVAVSIASRNDAQPLRVDRIALRRLAAPPGGAAIAVEHLAVATGNASLELGGTLRPVGDYPLTLDAAWRARVPLSDEEPPLDLAGGGTVRGSLGRGIELEQRASARPANVGDDTPSPVQATVRAKLTGVLDAPRAEADVSWSRLRWPFDGEAVLESQGEAHVTGDLERLEIEGSVRARGPQVPESELELSAVTDLASLTANRLELRTLGSTITGGASVAWRDGLTWEATLEGRDLDPSVQWPDWSGSLALAFDGSGSVDDDGVARTEATLDRIRGTLRGYPVSATGEVLIVGRQLESLVLEGRSGSATLRLAGSIREQADLAFTTRVPELGEVLPEAGGSVEAEGTLSGDRTAPTLELDLRAADAVWREIRLSVLSSTVTGVIAEGGRVGARLDLEALESEPLDASAASLRLDGTLGGLDLEGLGTRSALDARLDASGLRVGSVRASSLSVDLEGSLAEHAVVLSAESLEQEGDQQAAQRLTVRAAGGASEASPDGQWSGTLQELRLLAPGLGRWALDSEVALALSREEIEIGSGCWRRTDTSNAQPPSVCGEARWNRVEPWSLRAELSAIPLGLLDPLLASLTETDSGAVRAAEIEGSLDARLRASGVGLAIEGARAEITRLEGSVRAGLESGSLLDVPFRTSAGALRLDAEGVAGRARIELPENEGAISARVEIPGWAPAQGQWAPPDDQALSGTFDVRLEDATFLEALVPELREPRGTITAALALAGTAGRPSLNGTARLAAGSGRLVFVDSTTDAEPYVLDLADARVDARIDSAGVFADLSVRAEDPAGNAQGTIELPGYRLLSDQELAAQPLRGRIELALDGISLLAELLPQLADVEGQVDGAFSLAGTVGSPGLDGRADLRGFSARIPELAVELTEGSATIHGTPGESLQVTASVRSGAGTLDATGTIETGDGGWSSELKLAGTDLTVANTSEIRLRASPDLTVLATAEVIDVRGQVELPWARIVLRDLPEQAIEPSTDIVRVDVPPKASEEARAPGPRVTGRIRLVLGDDFEFEGFGFDIEPTGSLLITETGHGSTTATGQLLLGDGEYRAYGQRLEITEGRMLFGGGPIQNPALAVEAYRTVGTVQAGVRVSGNLLQPIVKLASSPAMPESDILHYMVLGRAPGKVTSADEADLLANAAVALGIGGGNLLARKLAARYDLDQLGIETDGGLDSAALVVGKYLSPRLYVSYGIGLLEPISTVTLRYILSSKWTVYAERGRGTGADLVYTIETGKRSLEKEPQ